MSDESYRVLATSEIDKYKRYYWFNEEVLHLDNYWLVPEKYLKKDIDKKEFYLSKLEELINGFDFDTAHRCMDALNWRWVGIKGTPEKKDMILVVRGLYKSIEQRILNEEYSQCSTGGFKLEYIPDNELRLTFEAVSFSVDDDRREGLSDDSN